MPINNHTLAALTAACLLSKEDKDRALYLNSDSHAEEQPCDSVDKLLQSLQTMTENDTENDNTRQSLAEHCNKLINDYSRVTGFQCDMDEDVNDDRARPQTCVQLIYSCLHSAKQISKHKIDDEKPLLDIISFLLSSHILQSQNQKLMAQVHEDVQYFSSPIDGLESQETPYSTLLKVSTSLYHQEKQEDAGHENNMNDIKEDECENLQKNQIYVPSNKEFSEATELLQQTIIKQDQRLQETMTRLSDSNILQNELHLQNSLNTFAEESFEHNHWPSGDLDSLIRLRSSLQLALDPYMNAWTWLINNDPTRPHMLDHFHQELQKPFSDQQQQQQRRHPQQSLDSEPHCFLQSLYSNSTNSGSDNRKLPELNDDRIQQILSLIKSNAPKIFNSINDQSKSIKNDDPDTPNDLPTKAAQKTRAIPNCDDIDSPLNKINNLCSSLRMKVASLEPSPPTPTRPSYRRFLEPKADHDMHSVQMNSSNKPRPRISTAPAPHISRTQRSDASSSTNIHQKTNDIQVPMSTELESLPSTEEPESDLGKSTQSSRPKRTLAGRRLTRSQSKQNLDTLTEDDATPLQDDDPPPAHKTRSKRINSNQQPGPHVSAVLKKRGLYVDADNDNNNIEQQDTDKDNQDNQQQASQKNNTRKIRELPAPRRRKTLRSMKSSQNENKNPDQVLESDTCTGTDTDTNIDPDPDPDPESNKPSQNPTISEEPFSPMLPGSLRKSKTARHLKMKSTPAYRQEQIEQSCPSSPPTANPPSSSSSSTITLGNERNKDPASNGNDLIDDDDNDARDDTITMQTPRSRSVVRFAEPENESSINMENFALRNRDPNITEDNLLSLSRPDAFDETMMNVTVEDGSKRY